MDARFRLNWRCLLGSCLEVILSLLLTFMPTIFDDQSLQKYLPSTPVAQDQTSQPATTAPQQSNPSAFWPMLAAGAGIGLDGLSTVKAGMAGQHELDPVLGSNATKAGLIRAGLSLPEMLLIKYLNDHNHPTAAKVLGYGSGIAGGAAGIHNLLGSK